LISYSTSSYLTSYSYLAGVIMAVSIDGAYIGSSKTPSARPLTLLIIYIV